VRHHASVLYLLTSLTVLVASCDDGPVDPSNKSDVPDGLIISEPASLAVNSTRALSLGVSPTTTGSSVAWVSAEPGTFADVIDIQIRNVTTDGPPPDPIAVQDGGFDPIPVLASAGDELEFALHQFDGRVTLLHLTVPPHRPPVVVRTHPPKGRTDVALNVQPIVVFSEPIEPITLTFASFQLRQHDTQVAGTVALVPESPFTVQFIPDSPLAPSTTYELVVTPEIRDLDGDFLEAEVRVEFTTLSALTDQIVFSARGDGTSRNAEIYVMKADGAGLRNLTNHPAWDHGAAVSPDGTKILFWTDRDGNDEIYIMNPDGSGLVNLTNDPAWDRNPIWSPDGTKIAFARALPAAIGEGCRYAATIECWDIFVMKADGSSPVNLTGTNGVSETEPTWSPDGTKIAFTSDRDACSKDPDVCAPENAGYFVPTDIFVMNADGSNVVNLNPESCGSGVSCGFAPAWSPDGTKIAFTSALGGLGISVMDADGSNRANLTAGIYFVPATRPSWSPDGSRIVFSMVDGTRGGGDDEVFAMNADGSSLVLVLFRPESEDQISSSQAWSR